MLFSLPTRSINTVFSCTLYDELFVEVSLLVPLLPEGYTAFDTGVRVFRPDSPLSWRLPFSSMRLSPNGKFVNRVPCVSTHTRYTIYILTEMFGYVLVSYGRERTKCWGNNSLEY